MKQDGRIRRFGASVKHQKAGFTHNAMVAWKTDSSLADAAGRAAAGHPRVSHCYFRPSPAPDWPYTLFTMIHGRSEEECRETVEQIRAATSLEEHVVLASEKELKKISMAYF
jgi:DNA-binding Lrp family transcriptional regulator